MARLTLLLAAPPADALYRSMRVLRRLGARITRYDVDEGTLEARTVRGPTVAVVRVSAEDAGRGATRVAVTSERLAGPALLAWAADAWSLRRFRRELGRSG